jgi:hypothetical protein
MVNSWSRISSRYAAVERGQSSYGVGTGLKSRASPRETSAARYATAGYIRRSATHNP